jgi:hypothetical protein
MDFLIKTLAFLKGWKTYIAAGITSAVAVVYMFFTWDLIGGFALLGLSAQAAALRDALNTFKKSVEEKLFGSD